MGYCWWMTLLGHKEKKKAGPVISLTIREGFPFSLWPSPSASPWNCSLFYISGELFLFFLVRDVASCVHNFDTILLSSIDFSFWLLLMMIFGRSGTVVTMFLTRFVGRRFLAAASARSESTTAAAAASTIRTPKNPLEEFFEFDRSQDEDKPVVYGAYLISFISFGR